MTSRITPCAALLPSVGATLRALLHGPRRCSNGAPAPRGRPGNALVTSTPSTPPGSGEPACTCTCAGAQRQSSRRTDRPTPFASLAAEAVARSSPQRGRWHRGIAPRARCAPTRAATASPPARRRADAALPCLAAAAGRPATPASRRMNPTCAPRPPTSARRDEADRHPSLPSARRARPPRRRAPTPPLAATPAREGPSEYAPPAARP